MKKTLSGMLVGAVLWSGAVPALAAEADVLAALDAMKRQMTAMQQTIDAQNARIQTLEARLAERPQAPVVLEPAEGKDAEARRKTFKQDVEGALPWLKGVKQSGDFRLRMEHLDLYDKNNDAGSTGTASDRSRTRTRIRLRWGLEKDFGDGWKAGFRLATGGSTENTSTNQTLGNRGYFTLKDIFLDRAYAKVSPSALKDKGALKGVTVGAGKVENPFQRYSTGIVWDSDVTPEGLYERAHFSLLENGEDKLALETTLGQFIVNENAGSETDAQLYGYQAALVWTTGAFGGEKPSEIALAASYYDYPNWFQTVTSNTAGVSYLRTNTSALDDPRVLNIYPEATFHFVPGAPVTLWGDFAENVGSIDPTRAGLSDAHAEDTAWGLGLKVGKSKKKGDWEVFYGYYEIGANAVVAAFSDADFGGPGNVGYTNRVGHRFGLGYQITDNVAFSWNNYLVSPLHAAPASIAPSALDEKAWKTQADVSLKF